MKKQLNRVIFCSILAMISLSACKEHELFELDGKREYIQGSTNSSVLSGRNRVKINFTVPNNAVKLVKIYWDNRANVKEVAVNSTGNVSTIIGSLPEGTYNFELIGYDAAGNASVPYKLTGTALGTNYEATLNNRAIKDVYYDENGTAVISWDLGGQALEMQLNYTDQLNMVRKVVRPATADTTQLVRLKAGELSTYISYKTAYLPVNSIDTFYAANKDQTVITGSLKALATAKDFSFGSLISYGNFAATHGVINDGSPNGIYKNICQSMFNFGQAAWGPSRWKREGGSDFNDANAVINWSKTNYGKVFLHLIAGRDVYMPTWFTTGTFTPSEMDVMLRNLVNEVMTTNDNKTKVDYWNVANELFDTNGLYETMKWNDMGWEDDASGLTGADKVNTKHPVFIGKLFQYARQNTNAVLELRDYNFEFNTSTSAYYHKHKAFYQLVKHMKVKGYPIDAVGIQAHYTIGVGFTGGNDLFKQTVKKFTDLGVKVYLTELDVALPKVNNVIPSWTSALTEQQKADYYNIIKTAYDAGIRLISVWGARDNNDASWKFGQSPLLYDENYKRKPAYYGVQKALFEIKK